MKTEERRITEFHSSVETVNITENSTAEKEDLSFDNPNRYRLKKSYPDIKFYGDESMIPKPIHRIVTKEGDWVELTSAVEIPGAGIIYRDFSIYSRHQDTAEIFIPGVHLEPVETKHGTFYKIVKD